MDQSLVFLPKMNSETSEDVLKIFAFINTLKAEMKKISDFSLEIPCSLLVFNGAIESLKKEATDMGWLEDAKLCPESNISMIEKKETGGLYRPLPRRGDMLSYKSWELFKASSSLVNQIGKGSSAFGKFVKGNEPKRTNEGKVCKKKRRRCWTQELHRLFVHAIEQLGDAQVATPKQITEVMGVKGLTTDEVKSHLQKYRLHIQSFPHRQLKISKYQDMDVA